VIHSLGTNDRGVIWQRSGECLVKVLALVGKVGLLVILVVGFDIQSKAIVGQNFDNTQFFLVSDEVM